MVTVVLEMTYHIKGAHIYLHVHYRRQFSDIILTDENQGSNQPAFVFKVNAKDVLEISAVGIRKLLELIVGEEPQSPIYI